MPERYPAGDFPVHEAAERRRGDRSRGSLVVSDTERGSSADLPGYVGVGVWSMALPIAPGSRAEPRFRVWLRLETEFASSSSRSRTISRFIRVRIPRGTSRATPGHRREADE